MRLCTLLYFDINSTIQLKINKKVYYCDIISEINTRKGDLK